MSRAGDTDSRAHAIHGVRAEVDRLLGFGPAPEAPAPRAPRVYADRPEEREVYRSGDPALTDRDRLLAFAAELDELDRTWASTPLAAERAALVRRAIDAMDRADGAEAELDALRAAVRECHALERVAADPPPRQALAAAIAADDAWERVVALVGEG